jgi:hypothetical protein
MGIVAAILVIVGIGFIVTRVLSRRSMATGHRPSAYNAAVGALITGFVMAVIVYGPDLFTRRFWHDAKAPMVLLVPLVVVVCTFIALIAATAVIMFQQKRTRK